MTGDQTAGNDRDSSGGKAEKMPAQHHRLLPLWLKAAFSVFLALWMPLYWKQYGPANFLWFCDLANYFIAVGLWLENSLILSTQAVSILLFQALWSVDVTGRVVLGFHLIGGTEYMFNASEPLAIRLLSLFHLVTPLLVLFCIRRVGYDRRAWWVQSLIAWIVLAVCFFLINPDRNINWVWKPFGKDQTIMNPSLYFLLLLAAYPLMVYLPTHLVLKQWCAKWKGR